MLFSAHIAAPFFTNKNTNFSQQSLEQSFFDVHTLERPHRYIPVQYINPIFGNVAHLAGDGGQSTQYIFQNFLVGYSIIGNLFPGITANGTRRRASSNSESAIGSFEDIFDFLLFLVEFPIFCGDCSRVVMGIGGNVSHDSYHPDEYSLRTHLLTKGKG